MKAARAIISIACLVIGLGVTLFFVSRSVVPTVSGAFEGGRDSGRFGTLLLAVYGFSMTLFGVVLGAIYRRLLALRKAGTDNTPFLLVLRDATQSVDFQIGIVGSPLVFGLLWQALGDISVAGLTVIALQNGFTSHAVLDQLVPAKAAPATKPP